jgi:hypothetical protein
MRSPVLLCTLAGLLFSFTASGWHANGHTAIAIIGYQNLSPGTKTRVDAILRQHPDYGTWTKDLPQGSDAGLEAFVQASLWPDTIKRDARFYNESSRDAHPTPKLEGFPDMQVHGNWHYTDNAISTNGKPVPAPENQNIAVKIDEFRTKLDNPYYLSWMLHLVGDIHQPLHTVSRFTGSHLDRNSGADIGDRGGNLFLLDDAQHNLHSFWDGALGLTERADLLDFAASARVPSNKVVHLDTQTWVDESVQISKEVVYSLGPDAPGDAAVKPPEEYRVRAQAIAKERIGLAGYRLAAILNDRLH